MKINVLRKFFSSGIQALSVQVLSIVFFYLISLYLPKESFGLISWANALCLFITTLLSFGMEQVVVRRIAVSKTSDWAASAYLFHAIASSVCMLVIIAVLHTFFKNSDKLAFLPPFFLAQAIVYIASPLKQFLNAKEKFAPFGIIALVSNSVKILGVFLLLKYNILSIAHIAYLLIALAVFELTCLLTYILTKPSFSFSLRFKFVAYKKILKEAAPQFISVVFDSGLSRMDWILLGIISTTVVTADYSFAYRAFEIARLPIAIIGPVILPIFSRMLHQSGKLDADKKTLMQNIFIIEMFFATGIYLCANILWTPVISYITHGKYGASNDLQFFILSLCIPLHFFINLLWTIGFGSRKYKSISIITAISAVSNLVLNLILIPLYGGFGAAIAFLLTSIIQATCFAYAVSKESISFPVVKLLMFYALSTIIVFAERMLNLNTYARLVCAVILYVLFSIILQLISKKHLIVLKSLLKK